MLHFYRNPDPKMDDLTSSRKRKRPSYLQDFYDPSLFVEEPVLKKVNTLNFLIKPEGLFCNRLT